METKYLRINPADNVAVAIVNLPAGEHLSVDGIEITLNEDIPAGHKFALKNFAEGENVISTVILSDMHEWQRNRVTG